MAPASLSLPVCEVGTLTLTLQVIVRSKGTTRERVFAVFPTDHAVNTHHIRNFWFLLLLVSTSSKTDNPLETLDNVMNRYSQKGGQMAKKQVQTPSASTNGDVQTERQ